MQRLTDRLSPEVVAALMSFAVVAMLLGVRGPNTLVPTPAASRPPAASVAPSASDGLSAAVRSALETVIVINGRLADAGRGLEKELARRDPRASEIAVVLPQFVTQTTAIGQQVTVLVADPATASLGADLVTAYGTLADLVRTALRESVQNGAAYVEAGRKAAELVRELEPLTARAEAILSGDTGRPSASPSVSPAPTGSAAVSPAPSRASSPPTAPPSAAAEAGLLVNSGFETGPEPWALTIVPDAAATLTIDTSQPGAGAAAARVDVTIGTDARSGISLVQTGVPVRAGQTYSLKILVRATAPRDLRLRLSATNGDTYIARVLPVTATWAAQTFTFDALVDDPAAELAIDLGRSDATTWIDSVILSPAG